MVRQYSAGGAVFKKEGDQVLWLLIQPAGGDKFHDQIRWQLPKGWINEGEKTEVAARREVAEEGGVEARIISKIDSIKIFFRNTFEGKPEEKVLKTITFYLMEYEGEAENGRDEEVAEIAWLPFEEAKERLTFKSEKEILTKAKEILENPPPQQALF
jgi:8-oxo-dGTP pyrophosphatase MutT (NUDIX family)